MGNEVVWEPGGVIKRFFGHASVKDLIEAAASVQGDPRFDDIKYVIVDFSGCTGHSVADPAMLEVIAIDEVALSSCQASRVCGQGVKVAIIASDPATMHLAEQYTKYSPQVSVRAFGTATEARNWIGYRS